MNNKEPEYIENNYDEIMKKAKEQIKAEREVMADLRDN